MSNDKGVGQGRALSGYLFNCGAYIEEECDAFPHDVNKTAYTDDQVAIVSYNCKERITAKILRYYSSMEAHFSKRGLMTKPEINELFCVKVQIGNLILDGHKVIPTRSLRFLGFHTNKSMTPKDHIQSRIAKINARPQKIREFRSYYRKNQLRVFYMAWIQGSIT